MQEYVSHYSDKTYLQYGVHASAEDITARQAALRDYGFKAIGEAWLAGYGYTAIWYGPIVSADTLLLLNLAVCRRISSTCVEINPR